MRIIEREVITRPETPDKPAELDEVGRILVRAAEIVRERGWCQREFKDSRGRVCLVGAIIEVDEDGYGGEAHTRMIQLLGGAFGWNDHPDRTAEEVVEALERAAYLP